MDYCFLGRVLEKTKTQEETTVSDLKTPEGPEAESEGVMPVLVIVDERTGAVFSEVVAKGVTEHAIHTVMEALKFCGRQRVILHTDAEPSIKAPQKLLGTSGEMKPRFRMHPGSHMHQKAKLSVQ